MFVFKLVYWTGMVAEVVARAPFQKTWRAGAKTAQRVSRTEQALLILLTVFAGVVPLIYSVTPWLDFANYQLPAWLGWLGVALLAGAALAPHSHTPIPPHHSTSIPTYPHDPAYAGSPHTLIPPTAAAA